MAITRVLILASALFGAAQAAVAQDAPDPETMTCEAFLALDQTGQTGAMLALRAAYNGEEAPEAPLAESGTTAGNSAASDADVEAEEASGSADPKLTGMRTACEGIPGALANDAMLAAHADYE